MLIERQTSIDTSFSLVETGMDLPAQMEMIKQTRNEVDSVETWKESIIQKNRADLEGLYFEYLIESGVLPFNLEFSGQRVTCPDYGNKPLPNVVSREERNGSIYDSVQLIEERLLSKDADSHVLISPPGWSGYKDPHRTTQIYYYQRKGQEIQSMTFVSRGTTLAHCEALYTRLTGEAIKPSVSEKERILQMTSAPLAFNKLSPHDVVSHFEEVTHTSLSEMHHLIDYRPEIQTDVKSCITDFELFVKNEVYECTEQSLSSIEKMLGKTILDMQSVLTRGRKPHNRQEYLESYVTFSEHEGCNGGGTIYSRGNSEHSEMEVFPNWGICAMSEGCISPMRGKEQSLGLCMICKTCDLAFRSGKTETEIREVAKRMSINKAQTEVTIEKESLLAKAAFVFIWALFNA